MKEEKGNGVHKLQLLIFQVILKERKKNLIPKPKIQHRKVF